MLVQTNLLYRNISHEPRGVSGVFVSERHMTHKERFPMCVKFCCSDRPSGKSITSTAQSDVTESLRGGWYKGQQFFLSGLGKEEKISCFSTGHWISSNLAVNEKELRSNDKAESVILFWKNYVILCLIWLWNEESIILHLLSWFKEWQSSHEFNRHSSSHKVSSRTWRGKYYLLVDLIHVKSRNTCFMFFGMM